MMRFGPVPMGEREGVTEAKRPGPRPMGLCDTRLKVQPELLTWAKHQKEGFAGLVRKLLAKEFKERTGLGFPTQGWPREQ